MKKSTDLPMDIFTYEKTSGSCHIVIVNHSNHLFYYQLLCVNNYCIYVESNLVSNFGKIRLYIHIYHPRFTKIS
jgi:bacterioferritin (cytochrome b1)